MEEIHKADPAARMRALRYALGISFVFFVLIVWFLGNRQAFVEWLLANLDMLQENSWIPWAFILLLMSPLVFFGAYMLRTGARIKHEKKYPTANMSVTRDTRIIRGESAMKRGTVLQVAGTALILGCLFAASLFRMIFLALTVQG